MPLNHLNGSIRAVVVAPLDSRVLVLNRNWQAVHICSARRAFALLYLGHAQVVDADNSGIHGTYDLEGWLRPPPRSPDVVHGRDGLETIGTSSQSVDVPSIIVLSLYDRLPKREVKFSRENVLRRDDFTCQYCGNQKEPRELNIDHVIPRDKSGRHCWENVVCSCIPCNTRKANSLPKEIGMIPMREPKAPHWRPIGFCDRFHSGSIDERWSAFIGN